VAPLLAGLGGELIARAFGGNPAIGRALGETAARLADPKVQAKLNGLGATLKAALRGAKSKRKR
jgi:hypothetical protein